MATDDLAIAVIIAAFDAEATIGRAVASALAKVDCTASRRGAA